MEAIEVRVRVTATAGFKNVVRASTLLGGLVSLADHDSKAEAEEIKERIETLFLEMITAV